MTMSLCMRASGRVVGGHTRNPGAEALPPHRADGARCATAPLSCLRHPLTAGQGPCSVSSMSAVASSPRTVASIIDGRPRDDGPGARITSTNPARLDDQVAEILLGDAS